MQLGALNPSVSATEVWSPSPIVTIIIEHAGGVEENMEGVEEEGKVESKKVTAGACLFPFFASNFFGSQLRR